MKTAEKSLLIFLVLMLTIFIFKNNGENKKTKKAKTIQTQTVAPAKAATSEIAVENTNITHPQSEEIKSAEQKPAETSSAHIEIEENFFENIPKVYQIKDLTEEEIHTTPELVKEAGEMLAEMREHFVENRYPPKEELNFYLRCANEVDLFDSIRAVCAARADQKYQEITGQKISSDIFDEKILELKEQVSI